MPNKPKDDCSRIEPWPDPFARLPALAERLGVKETPDAFGWNVRTRDGRTYSIFDLINAVIDRVDKGQKQ